MEKHGLITEFGLPDQFWIALLLLGLTLLLAPYLSGHDLGIIKVRRSPNRRNKFYGFSVQ